MIEFKQVEISDKKWASELLAQSDIQGCEYTFGNCYMWSEFFDIKIARYKDFFLVKNKYGFLFPAGKGVLREVITALAEISADGEVMFTNADNNSLELLRSLYGVQIEVSTNRDFYDYVYERESLSTLAGRKLHSKRNHLHRFYENDWSYEPITPDNIEECAYMHNQWCDIKKVYTDRDKFREAFAVVRGLEYFFDLGFTGGIIRVNGTVQAYTFGEPLINTANDTFVVHAEKAFSEIQGAYTAINREFVTNSVSGYKYINREEDMGEENLRKAKMSYRPAFMVEKYRVKIKC